MKIYVIAVLLTVLFSFIGSGIYTVFYSPEVRFWKNAIDQKIDYLENLDRTEPVFFFVGGSSCAFSVDPTQLSDKFGIRAVNLGLHAGAGRALQLEVALQRIKAGDVLVIAFETSFWYETDPLKSSALGSQLYFASPRLRETVPAIRKLGVEPGWKPIDLRPGGYHLVTAGLKALLGSPSYRYKSTDIREGGLILYSQELIQATPYVGDAGSKITDTARSFLQKIVSYATENKFEVVVSLPWQFTDSDCLSKKRDANAELLRCISEICPVLMDPSYGAQDEPQFFSDTFWHLTARGVKLRTTRLGDGILAWMARGRTE